MAEEPETEDDIDAEGSEEESEAPKKGGMKKLILFVGLPAVIVILAGVAGALLFLGGGDETAVAEGEAGEVVEEPEPSAAERFAALHTFERTIEVNIEGDEGRILMMQMEYVLVYSDHDLDSILESDVIIDRLTTSYVEFLRTLRADDIYGSMGTFRIRAEMRRRANLELAPHAIEDVLIPELIIA